MPLAPGLEIGEHVMTAPFDACQSMCQSDNNCRFFDASGFISLKQYRTASKVFFLPYYGREFFFTDSIFFSSMFETRAILLLDYTLKSRRFFFCLLNGTLRIKIGTVNIRDMNRT